MRGTGQPAHWAWLLSTQVGSEGLGRMPVPGAACDTAPAASGWAVTQTQPQNNTVTIYPIVTPFTLSCSTVNLIPLHPNDYGK